MSTTRQILAAALAGLSLTAGSCAATAIVEPTLAATPTVCHEDQPCWTWSTMGNLSRGVVTTGGKRRIVEPCRFAALDFHGRIDWKRTPRLRGDAFARANGCNPRLYA